MVSKGKKAEDKKQPGQLGVREGDSQETGGGKDKAFTGVIGVDYTVRSYLRDRGVKYKHESGMVYTKCPACKARKQSLAIVDDLGTYRCGACSRRGSFAQLRRLLGDTAPLSVEAPTGIQFERLIPPYEPVHYYRDYSKALFGKKGKLSDLHALGLSDTLIKELRVGYSAEFDALIFPYLYRRSLNSTSYLRFLREPDDWWNAVGNARTASWFGQHRFKLGEDVAYICQTPLDAAVLMNLETNVLAPYLDTEACKLRSHHLALISRCSCVYVVPNPSDGGMRWAQRIQAEIGRWRCRVVQLDCYPRDIIAKEQEGMWSNAKRKAASTIGVRVKSATDWLNDVDLVYADQDRLRGLPTKLEPLDKLFGGWRSGEVTVLSGEPGIGKSTFAAFLSLLQASEGRPVLHVSFEVTPDTVVRKWVQMLAKQPLEATDRATYVQARRKLATRPLHLPEVYGVVELNEIRRSIYDAATRFGTRFIVIDHLGFMTSFENKDHVRELGYIMREVKRWSLDLGAHILLLHHLRKAPPGERKRRVTGEDLRGSAEVGQLSDNVFILSRPRGGFTTRLDLIKVRDDVGYEGQVYMTFDPGSLIYLPTRQPEQPA